MLTAIFTRLTKKKKIKTNRKQTKISKCFRRNVDASNGLPNYAKNTQGYWGKKINNEEKNWNYTLGKVFAENVKFRVRISLCLCNCQTNPKVAHKKKKRKRKRHSVSYCFREFFDFIWQPGGKNFNIRKEQSSPVQPSSDSGPVARINQTTLVKFDL